MLKAFLKTNELIKNEWSNLLKAQAMRRVLCSMIIAQSRLFHLCLPVHLNPSDTKYTFIDLMTA